MGDRPDGIRRSCRTVLCILVLGLATACGRPSAEGDARDEAPLPSGPYVGQTPPGQEPAVFAPGLVSTGLHTRDVAMTPDGSVLYFSVQVGPFAAIVETRRGTDGWSRPEVASFSRDPSTMEIEPHVAPDGERLYFVSNRPADGSEIAEEERGQLSHADIWAADRTDSGWSEPYNPGPPVNTDAPEFFPSATRDGTLYFTREDAESGLNLIYRARPAPGGFAEPERLPDQVNSANQFNAFVSPDESYLILGVFGRDDSLGGTDYYVVFRAPDDTWSEPVNLGPAINRARGAEWSPYVSPDGRYFFFMSTRTPYPDSVPDALDLDWLRRFHAGPESGSPAIYWMDASFIAELEERAWSSDR